MTTNQPLTAETIALKHFRRERYTKACWLPTARASLAKDIEAYAVQQNAELMQQLNNETTYQALQRDEIESLKAENERLKAQLAWQPIETAPKDGRPILLTDGVGVREAFWYEKHPLCEVTVEPCWAHGLCLVYWVPSYILSGQTHWMPLPQPPKEGL